MSERRRRKIEGTHSFTRLVSFFNNKSPSGKLIHRTCLSIQMFLIARGFLCQHLIGNMTQNHVSNHQKHHKTTNTTSNTNSCKPTPKHPKTQDTKEIYILKTPFEEHLTDNPFFLGNSSSQTHRRTRRGTAAQVRAEIRTRLRLERRVKNFMIEPWVVFFGLFNVFVCFYGVFKDLFRYVVVVWFGCLTDAFGWLFW